MNGGDMDVYLTSNRIHYLCEESIQKYSTLKFKTIQGELVMMNPTILAALNSTLVHSLGDLDHEDCCVITQFTREDLEEIKNFSWTGENKIVIRFESLGDMMKSTPNIS